VLLGPLMHAVYTSPDLVSVWDTDPANAALPPTDSGPSAFGGLNHLEGFLQLPSEGYNISKARTSSLADLPLLREFPLCICTVFVFFF